MRRCKVGVNQRGAKGGAKLGRIKGIAMHASGDMMGVAEVQSRGESQGRKGKKGECIRGCQGSKVHRGAEQGCGGCNGRSRRRG